MTTTLTPAFVSQALGITAVDTEKTTTAAFSSVTTDSRKLTKGCLFVALKGDHFDGHDFLPTALAQGAAGIVCRRDASTVPAGAIVYRVDDTLAAYRTLGAAWRARFQIPVIAVAGSVGKTTTKELLASLLQGRWARVLKTTGSQNGFVGIPMTLLELGPQHGAAVIEVGIDDIGAMAQHIPLIKPTASMLTLIGPEHLEQLKDIATVAREETLALTLTIAAGGRVALNLSDPLVLPLAAKLPPSQAVAYAFGDFKSPPAQMGFIHGRIDDTKANLIVTEAGFPERALGLPLPGRHNAQNLLAAVAMARLVGLSYDEISAGLQGFRGAEGRSELKTLAGPTPVVCDYYNANPDSMRAGLDLLAQVATHHHSRQRWSCLGDMLELGSGEEGFHRGLADKILSLHIENVFLYGPRMRALQDELATRGFKGRLSHFASHAEMAKALVDSVTPGDAILIKGSRSMRMEEVWKIVDTHAQNHWNLGTASSDSKSGA